MKRPHNCEPLQLGIAWKYTSLCSSQIFLSIFFWPQCQMCGTCVPTIIRCTTYSVHRILFIVSCSDSNRIVALKQSLVQITYACSLWFCSNRCAFFYFVHCSTCDLRYVQFFFHLIAAVWSDFAAQVPCYFRIEADRISSVLFKWIEILTRIRVNTCAIVRFVYMLCYISCILGSTISSRIINQAS